jgi:hypothetical protein
MEANKKPSDKDGSVVEAPFVDFIGIWGIAD